MFGRPPAPRFRGPALFRDFSTPQQPASLRCLFELALGPERSCPQRAIVVGTIPRIALAAGQAAGREAALALGVAGHRRHHARVPAGMGQTAIGSSGQRHNPPPGRCGHWYAPQRHGT